MYFYINCHCDNSQQTHANVCNSIIEHNTIVTHAIVNFNCGHDVLLSMFFFKSNGDT